MALRSLLTTGVVLLVACSTPADRPPVASAAAPLQEAPAASTVASTDDDPLVCKWGTAAGTRIARKTCVHQSTLDQTKQNSQNTLDTLQRKAANGAPTRNN